MLSRPGWSQVLRMEGIHLTPQVFLLRLRTPWVSKVPFHKHSPPISHKNSILSLHGCGV